MFVSGEKYLITTDDWFYAPDGNQYRAVWGSCKAVKVDDVLGFSPIRPSTNWYLMVGSTRRGVILAGCRIHYAVKSDKMPDDEHEGAYYTDKDKGVSLPVSGIYYAE